MVPLGSTDMTITRLGLGAWVMGGGAWPYSLGAQDDRDTIATIRHAVAPSEWPRPYTAAAITAGIRATGAGSGPSTPAEGGR